MAGLLSELTGKTPEELFGKAGYGRLRAEFRAGRHRRTEKSSPLHLKKRTNSVSPVPGLAYDRFEELMAQADSLLGGGSDYAPGSLSGFGRRAKTYEEALADYRAAKEIDHFSGRTHACFQIMSIVFRPAARISDGFRMPARPPCQNAGFDLGQKSFLPADCRRPVFLTVLLSMLPILLLAAVDTVRSAFLYTGQTVDLSLYFKYTGGWILPTVMISAATGMFLTKPPTPQSAWP